VRSSTLRVRDLHSRSRMRRRSFAAEYIATNHHKRLPSGDRTGAALGAHRLFSERSDATALRRSRLHRQPKQLRSFHPTWNPSGSPSKSPTIGPSHAPSVEPTPAPSEAPTRTPSDAPTHALMKTYLEAANLTTLGIADIDKENQGAKEDTSSSTLNIVIITATSSGREAVLQTHGAEAKGRRRR